MKFHKPKISWPKPRLPRLSLSSSLAAMRGLRMAPPSIAPLRGGRGLYAGLGVAAAAALGALGWLFIWPSPHLAPPPAEAAGSAPAPIAASAPERQATVKEDVSAPAEAAQPAHATPAPALAAAPAPQHAPAEASGVLPEPPQPATEPERLVRQLQDLQERVAMGDAEAFAELPRLLRSIAQKFAAQPPDSWKLKANARALELYLLSGGVSGVGRKIVGAHQIAPSEEALMKGAIAYLDGIDCAERDAMLTLDPRALDAALGAQIAFVQSILLASLDRDRAVASLDLARLLAPGGLVEEAALRREIGLLGDTADFAKFIALSRQYWARFRRSPYADNFLRQFLGAAARVAALIKVEQWNEFEDFIESQGIETGRAVYLAMAKAAAVAGNSAFAVLAAQRAKEISAPDSLERQRALLYQAAARVADADEAQSRILLRDVNRERLPLADQPLYDATALVSAGIFLAPQQEAPPQQAERAATPAVVQSQASLKEAEAAIAAARKSMERKAP